MVELYHPARRETCNPAVIPPLAMVNATDDRSSSIPCVMRTTSSRGVSAMSVLLEGRLSGEEWVSIHLEQTSLLLAVGTLEGVDRWTNPNVDETDLGQHFLPGCTRQTTGNSSRPQVNFERRFGDRLAVRNVGKLESPAWAQHTPYFGEHGSFVGAQIDDAVANDDIRPVVFDWQMFCQSFADALIVKGSDGRDYDLSVEVLWNPERWT